MRRRLFTILSAVSLLLCVVMAIVWSVSYWREFYVLGPMNRGLVAAGIDRGSVWCASDVATVIHWETTCQPVEGVPTDAVADYHRLGFGMSWRSDHKLVCVPCWFVELGLILSSVFLTCCARRPAKMN
jgi:hypothetical protein